MSWYTLLEPSHVLTFFLLFIRFSLLFTFFPFYNQQTVPMQFKAAAALFLSLLLFPVVPAFPVAQDVVTLVLAVVSEVILGLIVGLALNIVFAAFSYAGEQIAFVMGFSLASAIDPQSNIQSPLISQFLTLMSLAVLLAFDGHHWIMMWLVRSVQAFPPGSVTLHHEMLTYVMASMGHLFVMGFVIAFPIIAMSLLSDVIFGMLMKTMPQFNLLVVGFPIKIALSLVVWMAIFGSMMYLFKREFQDAFSVLNHWLGI